MWVVWLVLAWKEHMRLKQVVEGFGVDAQNDQTVAATLSCGMTKDTGCLKCERR